MLRTQQPSRFAAASVLSVLLVSVAAAADHHGPAVDRTVVAYSFHGTLRCTTCLLVEQGAEEALRANFPGELLDGSLAWRSVNIRLPENRHYATEYEVLSWALLLVEYRGGIPGKWRNLSLAGELAHADADAFHRYVTAECRAFLDNKEGMKGQDK